MKDMPSYAVANMTADDVRNHGLSLDDHPENYVFHLVTWTDGHSGWIADTGDGKWWTMAFNADDIFDNRESCIAWLYSQLVS